MHSTVPFYREPLSLLTDLYQLTMAYGYWKTGAHTREAVFHLHFRKQPFGGGYAIACGLGAAVDWLSSLRFTDDDTAYLATLTGNDGAALFEEGFLAYLRAMRFECDIDAVPEGTAVFAQEPLVRVQGPLIQCQLVETALLDHLKKPLVLYKTPRTFEWVSEPLRDEAGKVRRTALRIERLAAV